MNSAQRSADRRLGHRDSYLAPFDAEHKKMLERYLGIDKGRPLGWDDLGHGAPTIIALSTMAAESFAKAELDSTRRVDSDQGPQEHDSGVGQEIAAALSVEAKAILFAARERGVIALKSSHQAFDSLDRQLSVVVETAPEQFRRFGSREYPRQSVRFLEGFAQLARLGLLVHQHYQEFSLTSRGFATADAVVEDEIAPLKKYTIDSWVPD